MGPLRALRGGISKVNFEQSLSTFGNTCPQNGSKNEPRAPRTSLGYPHIGASVVRVQRPGGLRLDPPRLKGGTFMLRLNMEVVSPPPSACGLKVQGLGFGDSEFALNGTIRVYG